MRTLDWACSDVRKWRVYHMRDRQISVEGNAKNGHNLVAVYEYTS